ncbi:MAG: penicillin-binding transpeptidase domain-containing protein, partial [Firmicutes bacterium]|nr:penicillin-binding transpeptidase domain-containing protein [Bacillota bacterium]
QEDEIVQERQDRFKFIQRGLAVCVALLTLRLAYMQLVLHEHYMAVADRNQVDAFAIAAPRGAILDARGKPLAVDHSSSSLLYAFSADTARTVATRLAPHLSTTPEALYDRMTKGLAGVHVLVASHISPRTLAYVREHQSELPGIRVLPDSVRVYPQGDNASHIIGYMNSIPDELVGKYVQQLGFPPSTKVGWSGVERFYDDALRGRPGRIAVELSSRGIPMRTLPQSDAPTRGRDIRLTIDSSYQSYVQSVLAHQVTLLGRQGHQSVRHAMAVAIDPRTGAVLAMASYPTYQPAWFVHGISYKTYQEKFAPAERNWVTQAPIAPGSTMKPLTALLAMAQGKITAQTTFDCDGGLRLPLTDGTVIHCWTRHGKVDLAAALAQSCDVYFYQASLLYGHWPPPGKETSSHWLAVTRIATLRKLEQLQRAFGLGVPTGIDLPAQASGYVNESGGQVTDIPYTAIGQNEVFTPMELGVYAATLANRGHRVTPYVVQSVGGQQVRKRPPASLAPLHRLGVTDEDISAVLHGMYLTCNDPLGTAYSTFHWPKKATYVAAGKTGTAETGVQGFDNAVFIGFAPYDHPRIAIAVVVPGGGHGADSSGPIARAMFDRFFDHPSRKMNARVE